MKIKDIQCSLEFFEDYDSAPSDVQKRVDKKLRIISINHHLLKSFQAHRVRDEEIWIAYITKNRQGYRLLFEVDSTGTMHCLRLVSHDDMDRILEQMRLGYY